MALSTHSTPRQSRVDNLTLLSPNRPQPPNKRSTQKGWMPSRAEGIQKASCWIAKWQGGVSIVRDEALAEGRLRWMGRVR